MLLAGVAAGCSTTQEKAERQQARAQHILEARKQRQNKKNHHNSEQHQSKEKNGGNG